jgi:SMODS-associating 4TM effector domain
MKVTRDLDLDGQSALKNMTNNIPQLQNEESALRLLAAQRRLYGRAKNALALQVILVVILPAFLLVIEHLAPGFNVWAAFIGLTISILDVLLFEPLKSKLRHKGAAIQELFDCSVLGLEWPVLKDHKPDREDVHGASGDYCNGVLKDWYPTAVGTLPLYVGRIICQRSNCSWDSKLRRHYRTAVVSLLAVAAIGVVVVALVNNVTFGDFVLSFMAPVLPVALWAIREVMQQSESADRSDHLKYFGDELWEHTMRRSLLADDATVQSRMLQDEIFEHRRENPLIFDWFYNLLRKTFEQQMVQSADDMIREAQEKNL